jgi:hypothetical protein
MSEQTRFFIRLGVLCFIAAWALIVGFGASISIRRELKSRKQARQRISERLGIH